MLRALGLLAVGACAADPGAAVCPDDAPLACPAVAPTFAADAAPVIRAHCTKCHGPGGMAKLFPFGSYAEIAPVAGDMKLMLETCQMPPATEPPLTPAERQTLFGWITCGALDD